MTDTHLDSQIALIGQRYQRLARRVQQLPPAGSRPLTVAGKVSGWVTPRATRALAALPGVHVEPEAVHIRAAASRRQPLNAVLAQVALTLKEAGCLRGWRDELLDVVGEGRKLSVIERAAVRPLGLLTKAVHLNAWSPSGGMWIARRAPTKLTDPGKWDTLAGGLAAAGETLDASLLRESNEEAGLSPMNLASHTPLRIILRMHRRLPEGYQVEDVLVSDCVLDESVEPHNQDGEVSEIQMASMSDLWPLIQADEFTLEAELAILDSLEKRFKNGAHA